MGLNVVKTVIEEHHGPIVVESEPERDTTFSLRLPCSRHRGAKMRGG